MAIPDLAITSLETISAFDVTTGAFKWTLDELQSASIEQAEESTDITGRAGCRLAALKRNKTVTISATNGLISAGLMATQTGGTFSNTTTEVQWIDYLAIEDDEATTTWKAYGTAGAEIQELYIRNADGTLGAKLTQNATVDTGKFKYTPGTKKLEFKASDYDDGQEIVVFYKRQITADVLSNSSAAFSGKVSLYIDALAEDTCGTVYRVQFYIPKADFSGNFTLDLGGDQTVHSFEASALAGYCGSNGAMWTYTVFGANTADYSA